jgi:nitroreductase
MSAANSGRFCKLSARDGVFGLLAKEGVVDFAPLIRYRQSVRTYCDRPVEAEKLGQLVEAVRLAPSACNAQPWTLVLVDDPVLKNQVAEATRSKVFGLNRFAVQAPVLAVLVMEKPVWTARLGALLQRREFALFDIGIAAAHFCLQAADLGLGTCMLGWFDEKAIKKLLRVPGSRRVALVITLGYPPQGYPVRPKARKDSSAMSRYNRY